MKSRMFFIVLFIKRFFFFLISVTKYLYSGVLWLIFSKEHTSHSLELSENKQNMIAVQISNFFEIKLDKVFTIFNFAKKISFEKKFIYNFNDRKADIDYKNKLDYRIIPLVLFLETDIKNIFEFGFNQGRLLYIINDFCKLNPLPKKQYIGIDYNKRKGGLIDEVNLNLKNEILYQPVEIYLEEKQPYAELENSILICSTHEVNSEEAIFNYLLENKCFPEVIISDNIKVNSSFMNFYNLNKSSYKINFFSFTDNQNFLSPIEIGVLKKLT